MTNGGYNISLRDVPLLREYRSYKNNIVKEFYIPVLREATKYQRAVGYFTSDALVEKAKSKSLWVVSERYGSQAFFDGRITDQLCQRAFFGTYKMRKMCKNVIRFFYNDKVEQRFPKATIICGKEVRKCLSN